MPSGAAVAHMTLNHVTLVRIQARQPASLKSIWYFEAIVFVCCYHRFGLATTGRKARNRWEGEDSIRFIVRQLTRGTRFVMLRLVLYIL